MVPLKVNTPDDDAVPVELIRNTSVEASLNRNLSAFSEPIPPLILILSLLLSLLKPRFCPPKTIGLFEMYEPKDVYVELMVV